MQKDPSPCIPAILMIVLLNRTEEIYLNVLASVKKCLDDFLHKGYSKEDISCIGISNQRETFVLWDKEGKPLHNAVVWQCKRSVKVCDELKSRGLSAFMKEKTGLIIDPYFSATKLVWLVQNDEALKKAVASGEVFFGTVDTWLLYKLTSGATYFTDHTNASRTLLFNLHTLQWDNEIINELGLKGLQLPIIRSSSSDFGDTTVGGNFEKPIPVTALIGDSHAAAFGEGCFDAGTAKATLGTGSSIMMNIGHKAASSQNGMVTTVCWSVDGRVDYALEGVIVTCGGSVEWLKNELNLFEKSAETEAMATSVKDNDGVYLIPAFSGLGSPHWQMERRASINGITFGTTKNHVVRAALESIPYQIMDVITAMELDTKVPLKELMTNGGLTSNKFVMNFLADLLGKPVHSSAMPDVSALGAAFMAGLSAGLYKNIDHLKEFKSAKTVYLPSERKQQVEQWYKGWKKAIERK